jgi:hypothetical protein
VNLKKGRGSHCKEQINNGKEVIDFAGSFGGTRGAELVGVAA